MNEKDLARKITEHLDQGLKRLDSGTLSQLRAARQHALEASTKPHRVLGLAWAGGKAEGHGGYFRYRVWLPLTALMLGLFFIFWQNFPQNNDVAEIDVHLLAGDLPIHAYLDDGFDTWLEGSSQN
jgi:hypothetical protein